MHKELWVSYNELCVALNGLCIPYNAFLGGEVKLPRDCRVGAHRSVTL